jgi:hypothetical protein
MKAPKYATVIALAALAVSVAFGQQTAPATTPGPQAKQAPSTPEDYDKQLAKMQAEMTKMQEQMRKIRETGDPQERQRLLQDHWTSMQSMMTLMNGSGQAGGHMMGGPMMGGHMMGGHMMMWGDYKNLTPEQLKQRQYMMDRFMPMQQMMMDQMMQHQYWMMQPQAPAAPPK